MRNHDAVIINNWPHSFDECSCLLPANITAEDVSVLHISHGRPPTISEVYNFGLTKIFNSSQAITRIAQDEENKSQLSKIIDEAKSLGVVIDMSKAYSQHLNPLFIPHILSSELHIE